MDMYVIDMETHYSKEFSLTKQTTEEYVRSPLFEVIGFSYKRNDEPAVWVTGDYDHCKDVLDSLNLQDAAVACHNTLFDGAILSWHYGIQPARWFDTLCMGRAVDGVDVGGSLAAMAERYGAGVKGTEVINALGKRRLDFTADELAAYGAYCVNDTEMTAKVFHAMMGNGFPTGELKLIDLTIRMFTNPRLVLDPTILETHLQNTVATKRDVLVRALAASGNAELAVRGAVGDEEALAEIKKLLASNPQFAALLESFGVTPPRKISPATGKETWALAKTDEGFTALLEHDDVRVQALCAARLGTKSTLEETRTRKFITMAERGPLPIPLKFFGARCVTGDTEVLTPHGWVRIDAWGGGAIAQYQPSTAGIVFSDATRFVGPVEEHWVRVDAPYMPAMFTMGHTVPYLTHGTFEFKTMQAGDLLSRGSAYIPVSGTMRTTGAVTSAQMKVLVMVQADGSFCTNARQGRGLHINVKKPRKIQRARALLTAAGVAFRENTFASCPGYVRFSVAWADLPAWLAPDRKVFGAWLLDSTQDARAAFMAELAHWDGWTAGGQECYSSCVATNAEWVTTLAHLSGMSATHGFKPGRGNRLGQHEVRLRKRAHVMTFRANAQVVSGNPALTYCPETTTGFWLARREGRIFVTGNTGRWSGEGGGVNFQNLPRGSEIKRAVRAPAGKVLVGVDLSNIELRVGLWLAGEHAKLKLLGDGLDMYKDFASKVFNVPYAEVTKDQRFIGKTSQLSLIYGVGAAKLRAAVKSGSGTDIGDEEAKRIVAMYRAEYAGVVSAWRDGDAALRSMMENSAMTLYNDLLAVEGRAGILLPSGILLRYPNLHTMEENGKRQWVYKTRKGVERLYGAKVFQGITQAVARCVMGTNMTRIDAKYPMVLTVHDAVYCLADAADGQQATDWIVGAMCRPPKWMPDIPLAAEGAFGASLLDC